MKRVFEIRWDDLDGPEFVNERELKSSLALTCGTVEVIPLGPAEKTGIEPPTAILTQTWADHATVYPRSIVYDNPVSPWNMH